MKTPPLTSGLVFALAFCSISRVAAQTDYEEALKQVAAGINTSLGMTSTATVLVNQFKRMDGSQCDIGELVTLDFEAALLSEAHTYKLLDRSNLTKIAEEHKLAMEGMMDDEQRMKEAGRLLKADAIVFGTYAMMDGVLLLRVKAVDIQSSEQLAIVPANCRPTPVLLSACDRSLPSVVTQNGGSNEASQPTREVVRVLDSGSPCGKSTGGYCFVNGTNETLSVTVTGTARRSQFQLILQPGGRECLSEKPVGAYSYSIGQYAVHWTPMLKTYRQGEITIEPCGAGVIAYPPTDSAPSSSRGKENEEPCSTSTGSYCFKNNGSRELRVNLFAPQSSGSNGGGFQVSGGDELMVRPGRQECYYDRPAAVCNYTLSLVGAGGPTVRAGQGTVRIERCKTGTYEYP